MTQKRLRRSLLTTLLSCAIACSSSGPGTSAGSGGTSANAGATGNGGSVSSGGTSSSGGNRGSGGAAGSGGTTTQPIGGSGGASATGGGQGKDAAAGTSGGSGGQDAAIEVSPGSGGSGKGGSSATGGSTGGATGTGGSSSTGGTGGSSSAGGGGGTTGSGGSASGGDTGCGVPTSFKWSSTDAIISPASGYSGIKDPSVVFFNNLWHIFASTTDQSGGYSITSLNFSDWSQASSASQTNLKSTIGGGAAPQVFYFTPQKKWYMIFEWPDVYSTNTDIGNATGWTSPKSFYSSEPSIVTQNQGSGGWIDFWVICDDSNCFLFFSDDNGHLYRAQTTVADFPSGFGTPVIVLSDSTASRLFEACNVYSMKGTGQYLLLVEAYDSNSSGRRYFRSWTAPALDGAWTTLQAEFSTPFASSKNVTFTGTAWTQDISHGEMIRSGYDEKLEIDTCNLQYLYQGKDPSSTASYNLLPWKLGLLTNTN